MNDLNLSLRIRLLDEFTRPAQRLRTNVRTFARDIKSGLSDAFRGAFSDANMERAVINGEAYLNRARGRLVGAFGMGLALVAPIKALGDFETALVKFGNTAGIYDADLASVETRLRNIAPAVNQSASELLSALEVLVGRGMAPDQALIAIEAIGMTATASATDIGQLAQTSYAALNLLNIPAEQLQMTLDAMAQSGKLGGFELSAMANHFPKIASAARTLGMEGVSSVAELTAALQVAREATGDDESAAGNFYNFLDKLSSPETVKRFGDMGVNIEDEFDKAAESGVTVFEHMLLKINEMTDGNSFRMGELFGDQQVGSFLKAVIPSLERYREIRDQAMSGEGANAADFGRVMETFEANTKSLSISMNNLATNAAPLLEMATELAKQLRGLTDTVADLVAMNPELSQFGVTLGAGLLALGIGTRAAAFVGGGLNMAAVNTINTGKGAARLFGFGKQVPAVPTAGVAPPIGAGAPAASAPSAVAAAEVRAASVAAVKLPTWSKWLGRAAFVSNTVMLLQIQQEVQNAIGGVMERATSWPEATRQNIQELRDELVLLKGDLGELDTGAPVIDGGLDPLAARRLAVQRLENQIQTMEAEANAAAGLAGPRIGLDQPVQPAMPRLQTGPGPAQNPHTAGLLSPVSPEVKQTIHAEVIDKRPPQVSVALTVNQSFSGVLDPRAAAARSTSGLKNAISQAMQGALHDGVD